MKVRLPSVIIGLLAVFAPMIVLARGGLTTVPGLVSIYGPEWVVILGVALALVGFVIGLGAVSVIDLHGLLARRSHYWTLATTRTHKITKPMIWIGIVLVAVGGGMVYGELALRQWGPLLFHIALMTMLVLNGLFLSFRVSPYLLRRERAGKAEALLTKTWQRRITASFVVSAVGWWTSLGLFFWYIIS